MRRQTMGENATFDLDLLMEQCYVRACDAGQQVDSHQVDTFNAVSAGNA